MDRFLPSEYACHGFKATTRGPRGPKNKASELIIINFKAIQYDTFSLEKEICLHCCVNSSVLLFQDICLGVLRVTHPGRGPLTR